MLHVVHCGHTLLEITVTAVLYTCKSSCSSRCMTPASSARSWGEVEACFFLAGSSPGSAGGWRGSSGILGRQKTARTNTKKLKERSQGHADYLFLGSSCIDGCSSVTISSAVVPPPILCMELVALAGSSCCSVGVSCRQIVLLSSPPPMPAALMLN